MDKPRMPNKPASTMIVNGVRYSIPANISMLELSPRTKFRWFKRSIKYYYHKETGTIVYPDWYLKELENLKI